MKLKNIKEREIRLKFDASTTGIKHYAFIKDYSILSGYRLTSVTSGDLTLDIKTCLVGSLPTTVSLITGGGVFPTISSGYYTYDDTLTDWTKTILAGSVLEISVTGTPTVTTVELILIFK